MSSAIKRIAMSMLLFSFVLTSGMVAAGNVMAQSCEDPTKVDNCSAGMDGYTDMLDNVFEVAHTTLQYAGFVTVFAGATLWFTARRSSDRAQTGVWLLIGGLAMIVFYFGFTAFVSLLKWIAEGGSS
ncbi:hypothetical protein [Halosimplex pelagicum]|uniref:Uncharacterized protein n=1 Tax=Halosimplex pelagicum TaxID=869886 RepID=A0A7D5PC83_9EURY|nr:hypothetical protein [Halosimplex pelagicum]QLH82178.1 hypothetical protein HZS54_11425 [Halosimplex pelagicum]